MHWGFGILVAPEIGSPPTCPKCDYSLTGHSETGRCPECGDPYQPAALLFRRVKGQFPALLILLPVATIGTCVSLWTNKLIPLGWLWSIGGAVSMLYMFWFQLKSSRSIEKGIILNCDSRGFTRRRFFGAIESISWNSGMKTHIEHMRSDRFILSFGSNKSDQVVFIMKTTKPDATCVRVLLNQWIQQSKKQSGKIDAAETN